MDKPPRWSESQLKALKDYQSNVLVNAGAGSGKTRVMTNKVFNMINTGKAPSSFLVLTFTDAAANKMRNDILELLKNGNLSSSVLASVEYAHIETFDSFFLYLVKKYCSFLHISPDVKIIDKNVFDIKKKKTLESIFESYYASKDQDFLDLVSYYCIHNKSHKVLFDFVIKIYDKVEAMVDPEAYLDSLTKLATDSKIIEEIVSSRFQDIKDYLIQIKNKAEELEDSKDCQNIQDFCDLLLKIDNYDDLYNALQNSSFPNKPKGESFDKEYRENVVKKIFKDKVNNKYGSIKEIYEYQADYVRYIHVIVSIVKNLQTSMKEFMDFNNCFTFNEIAKKGISVLNDEDNLRELRYTFKYIFVDEYQDTSPIQEACINKLDNNNIFMVGDVKQSIYRFRHADCSIFQKKYERYCHNDGGIAIDMVDNFRSRKEMVDDLNSFFSIIMDKKYNPIDFKSNHLAISGNKEYIDEKDYLYGCIKASYVPSDKIDMYEEACLIRDDIIFKIKNQYRVSSGGISVPVSFEDFTILVDRGTDFGCFVEAFSEKKVPLYVKKEENIASKDVVNVFSSMIKFFNKIASKDFENDDYKHYFVSLARSFLFELEDKDIYHIFKDGNIYNNEITNLFSSLVQKYKNSSLYEIATSLLDELHFYELLIKIGDIDSSFQQISSLLEMMKSFDDLGYDLQKACDFFDDVNELDLKIEVKPNEDIKNCVRLMTIHKSKGLDFNIVYIAGNAKTFNRKDYEGNFFISEDVGMIFPKHSDSLESIFAYHFKKKEIQKDFEEKLRVFYVGLSRAKEACYVLIPEIDKKMPSRVEDIESFVDMINFFNVPFRDSIFFNLLDVKLKDHVDKLGEDEGKKLQIKEIPEYGKTLIKTASGVASQYNSVDEKVLEKGILFHKYLEIVNFNTKDTSFIKDKDDQRIINKILQLDIFSDLKSTQVIKEFSFFDNKNNVNGIIDLLLIKEDEIVIVDYKTSDIDNPSYITQLYAYKNYVASISALPIRMMLLSILKGKIKEIKDNEFR